MTAAGRLGHEPHSCGSLCVCVYGLGNTGEKKHSNVFITDTGQRERGTIFIYLLLVLVMSKSEFLPRPSHLSPWARDRSVCTSESAGGIYSDVYSYKRSCKCSCRSFPFLSTTCWNLGAAAAVRKT